MLDSSLLIEYVQDIKYAYFGQAVWGVCLGFILLYFNKLYRRKYLECWAYSLFAFSSLIAFALVSFYTSSVFGVEPFWQSLSFFLYLTATFIHIYWLLRGVRHLTDKNSIRPKAELIFYVASIIIALSVSLFNLFANVEGSFASVQIFPFFVKTLTVGIVFVYAGLKIMRLGRNDGALGKKLLWIAFLLYGFQDLQYAVSCVYLFFDNSYILNIEASMGVIDLLVLSFIGIGMIIWLLEDERSTLEKTNKELDSFLYSTSHDLRAPVASLLGLINIAKHDIKEEQGVKYISMMEER
ncbi:MAG: signal transduction histidine kinase, partial [Marivirga sp.]